MGVCDRILGGLTKSTEHPSWTVEDMWSLAFFVAEMGTPNREPQESSSNLKGIHLPGSSYSVYISTVFLRFPI